jgi:hypothetical protein
MQLKAFTLDLECHEILQSMAIKQPKLPSYLFLHFKNIFEKI